MGLFDQREFDIRCEWGSSGLAQLSPVSDVVIIVDVLSFSTAVDIATARGAPIFPYPLKDGSAAAFADSSGASLASSDRQVGFLFVSALAADGSCGLPIGPALAQRRRAVLLAARCAHVLTACLRNASAVAQASARLGSATSPGPGGRKVAHW